MAIELREVTDEVREELRSVRVGEGQERFVSSVEESLAEAELYPQAKPWFRAVYADGVAVGFVMISWDVEPDPPELWGPWFLWKLLIDERYQRRGLGTATLDLIVERFRSGGAVAMSTSAGQGEGSPIAFYERYGFERTGELHGNEVMLRLEIS